MSEVQTYHNCLNCDRSEMQIPLVTLRHAGQPAWICSQCLPVLIHHPEQLAGKLEGAEEIPPAEPERH
ncbi:MAG: hypothetical protein ACE5HA_16850 [Anaerolineae bacterium]